MTRFLLDVNILVPLIDPEHAFFEKAHDWFASIEGQTWLTCPITQNGAVRTVCQPRYPTGPASVVDAVASMGTITTSAHHKFIADDISLLNNAWVDTSKLTSHKQITDTYLLALATHHRATFVTFDKHVVVSSVKSPHASLLVVV